MSEQLSFWGCDEDGRAATTGRRIVYFYDCHNGRIKIGFTATGVPESRGRAGRTWIPELTLIGSVVVRADQNDKFLHERFGIYHIKGELFRDCPELRLAIHDLIEAQRAGAPIVFRVTQEMCGSDLAFGFNPDCLGCGRWFLAGMFRFSSEFVEARAVVVCPDCRRRHDAVLVREESSAA